MGKIPSRYAFAPINGNDGAFLFVTDEGCYYTIALSPNHQIFDGHDLLFNNGESYEISIDRQCDDSKILYDASVGYTIIHILSHYQPTKIKSGIFIG